MICFLEKDAQFFAAYRGGEEENFMHLYLSYFTRIKIHTSKLNPDDYMFWEFMYCSACSTDLGKQLVASFSNKD